MEEEIIRNEVKIAGKDMRTYIYECLRLFGKYDQIYLSTSAPYKDKTIYIKDFLTPVGIELTKRCRKGDIVQWEEKMIPIMNGKTGRTEDRIYFRIQLTKIPELFMYTDPDKKDIPIMDKDKELDK